jgi:hypothetical protein
MVEFDRRYLQRCGPPTRDLSSLAARFEERRGVRGGCEVLIDMVLMAITREKSTGVLLWRPFPETEREREKIAGGGR